MISNLTVQRTQEWTLTLLALTGPLGQVPLKMLKETLTFTEKLLGGSMSEVSPQLHSLLYAWYPRIRVEGKQTILVI